MNRRAASFTRHSISTPRTVPMFLLKLGSGLIGNQGALVGLGFEVRPVSPTMNSKEYRALHATMQSPFRNADSAA